MVPGKRQFVNNGDYNCYLEESHVFVQVDVKLVIGVFDGQFIYIPSV